MVSPSSLAASSWSAPRAAASARSFLPSLERGREREEEESEVCHRRVPGGGEEERERAGIASSCIASTCTSIGHALPSKLIG